MNGWQHVVNRHQAPTTNAFRSELKLYEVNGLLNLCASRRESRKHEVEIAVPTSVGDSMLHFHVTGALATPDDFEKSR